MKKKLICILVIIIVIATIFFVYKLNNNNKMNTVKKEEINNKIEIQIKEGTLSNTGLILIIYDARENALYLPKYAIEKMNSYGEWESLEILIEPKIWYSDIAITEGVRYENGDNSYWEIPINWEKTYGKLENGKYKIIKQKTEEGELSVEFEID